MGLALADHDVLRRKPGEQDSRADRRISCRPSLGFEFVFHPAIFQELRRNQKGQVSGPGGIRILVGGDIQPLRSGAFQKIKNLLDLYPFERGVYFQMGDMDRRLQPGGRFRSLP